MIDGILFPSDYFDRKIIDQELEKEYEAAIECQKYEHIFLFSYEQWFHHGRLVLNETPDKSVTLIYRGWMMLPEQYESFYYALKENGINLLTSPEEYARFHIVPNIYEVIKEDTPKTLIFPEGTKVDLGMIKREFDRFMVKDYVKSVKGSDFPIYIESGIEEAEFELLMEKFLKYRGGLFTGGICIKEYVSLKKYGDVKNEYRVFYANGEILTVSRNSGQPDYAPAPPTELVQKYGGLDSKFYTVDYAELECGKWIVIEAGDGGVSGLSDFQNQTEFYRKLYYALS